MQIYGHEDKEKIINFNSYCFYQMLHYELDIIRLSYLISHYPNAMHRYLHFFAVRTYYHANKVSFA